MITKEEVVSEIKKLKSRKAPGPDGISVEALKFFTDRMRDTLSVIFNKVVRIKHLPPRNPKIETQVETIEALQYS